MTGLTSVYSVTFLAFAVWGSLVTEGQLPPREVDAWWRELISILAANCGVFVGMYVGCVLSAGIVGVPFFAANGLVFGGMLASVPLAKVPWVLLYAPLEMAAFALAFLGGRDISLAVVRGLAGNGGVERCEIMHGACRAVVAFGLLVVAAALEVAAIFGAWND